MRSASEKMNNERHWVANLRSIANRPGRVTTLGQSGCHVIFRPCRPCPILWAKHDRPQKGDGLSHTENAQAVE